EREEERLPAGARPRKRRGEAAGHRPSIFLELADAWSRRAAAAVAQAAERARAARARRGGRAAPGLHVLRAGPVASLPRAGLRARAPLERRVLRDLRRQGALRRAPLLRQGA